MALSQNQRNAVNRAPVQFRTQLAERFRRQNAMRNNRPIAQRNLNNPRNYSGNGPRQINIPLRNLGNLRGRARFNNAPRIPAFNFRRNNSSTNRNSGWNNLNTITIRVAEQLVPVVVNSGTEKDYMIRSPINPRFQTTANRYSNIYGKFRYSKFEYRFVSIAPTTSTDTVLFSFTENNRWFLRNSTNASQGIGFHNANASKNTPWKTLINNDEPNKWYDTPQSASSQMTEQNTQGWFHRTGFGGTVNHNLGFVEVRYILHFHSPIAGTDRNEASLEGVQDDPLPEFNALKIDEEIQKEASEWLTKKLPLKNEVSTNVEDNESYEELPYDDRGELDD